MPDTSAKKRKHAPENSSESVPVASSSAQPDKDESGVANVPKSPTRESGALDINDKQKIKTRRVKFSEEADVQPIEPMDNDRVGKKNQRKGSSDATKDVRPILKKAQEGSKKMDVDKDGNEEEEEEKEEEYYLSSRSPTPEGGLSDKRKWERLYKYAGRPESSKRSTGIFTGISLDDEDEEPAMAAVETPERDGVRRDGMFSGVLSEQEDEETGSPRQSTLGSKATDSVISKKKKKEKKSSVESPQQDGSNGIFSGIFSDPEEEDQPRASTFDSKDQDNVDLKKTKKFTEEPEMSSDALPDQSVESSDFEDANKDLRDTKSSDSEKDEDEDEDEDEEEDEDEDMDDFEDAPALKSFIPTPLNEAAKASKWARMFESATSVAEPVDGAFSGSLDEVGVSVRARPAVREQRMFESAAANQTGIVSEAPTASDKIVASGNCSWYPSYETIASQSIIWWDGSILC